MSASRFARPLLAAGLAVWIGTGCSERESRPPGPVVVPAGTPLSVVLDQALTTRIHRAGDPFVATVREAVVVGGQVVIAAGASLQGRVQDAVSGARSDTPRLVLSFTRVVDEEGVATPVDLQPLRMEGAPPDAETSGVRSPLLGDEIDAASLPVPVARSETNEIELPIGQRLVLAFAQPAEAPVEASSAGP